ncbi:MAG TPA: glycosyltransferase family 9 protein [Acetobacteraceae bacterium]|nr:glycosyltransferase family 9 protein [Acetobacteraceae bacterium]
MSVAIVIAPLSNDTLRDWPLTHFERLARLCVDRLDARIDCVGIRAQRVAVNQIVRNFPPDRVRNLCGTMAWADTAGLLRSASCVVANNSGIAHLAAGLGVPTVCVFGASHNPYEWMARGPLVTTVHRRTGCAPCAFGSLAECPFDKRCLREIAPETVFEAVRRACAAADATVQGSPAAA